MDEYIQVILLFKSLALSAEQFAMSEQTSPLPVDCLDVVVNHLVDDDLAEIFLRPVHIGSYPNASFNDAVFLFLVGV